jgi:hypothetical protein
MDELNGHCPLADTGGDSFDGTMPYIPGGEDTGDAGFQKERIAVKRPVLWPLSLVQQVGACENEALLVAFHHILQPARMRLRTNEDEP